MSGGPRVERSAGSSVCGRIELLREEAPSVGVQVFGPTWVVLDASSGELARACLLDDELLPSEAARAAFVTAAQELASLRDPALVPQLFAGADGDGGAVLYEPLSGAVAFDDLYDGTGSYDLGVEVGRLARQLARALAALHARERVHGLLTTACVFVGPRGPSVYQYGLAPLCDRAVLLRRIRAFDLPGIAPEVLAGGPFTPAADLYAWAVAVVQFATAARGAAALAAFRAGHELPGVSTGLRAAIQECLSEVPSARPVDGNDLLRRIDTLGLGEASGMLPRPDAFDLPVTPPSAPPAARPPTIPPTSTARPPTIPPTSTARPPTIPPTRPPAPPRPPGAKDRPPTIPPSSVGASMTSLEDMLMSGDRVRRPGAPLTPAAPSSSSSSRGVVELGPEDLLHESGMFPKPGGTTGKSSTNLRRVHVLTDPVKRSDDPGLAPIAPDNTPPPGAIPGDTLIGGTREELEAASRATTLRLNPGQAAEAVMAANAAAARAAKTESEPAAPVEPAAKAASGVVAAAASTPASGAVPQAQAARVSAPVPVAEPARARSGAVAAAGEDKPWPRDGLVPAAPTGSAAPAPPADARKPPLALILGVLLALLLLALVLARG
jgi:hypothetical protein